MNILIIDNSIAFTGAFKCALNEAEILSDRHRFIFIIPSKSKVQSILSEKGYPYYTLPLKEISKSPKALLQYPFYFFRNLAAIRSIGRKEKIEVIQVNDFYNLLGAALKILGFKGKLLTYIRFLPSAMPAALRKLWITAAQRYSEKVIAVSDAVLQQLPLSEKNIRLYDPVQLEEKLAPKTYSSKREITFLYLSNFMRGKGQEHALQAFAEAYQKNQHIRLKFIGGDMGLKKNAAFKNELILLANKLGLKNVVAFKNFTNDVEEEIKSADVLLNFSEAESFSMTCLEAAFYGIPVIVTRCGGPEEIIQDNETGLLVAKGNIPAMTQSILRLATNELLRKELGENAREYVRRKFNVASFKKTFSAILSANG